MNDASPVGDSRFESTPIDAGRYPHLATIDSPADLRKLDATQLRVVADELRAYLIECVGQSGGHFGAGLGVIELTTALHYLYDTRTTASSGTSATRPTRTRS